MKKITPRYKHWYLLLGFLFTPLFSSMAQAKGDDRPNILWLSVEDISPLIGAYGYDDIRTPNIDKLATEGVLYNNAYVTAPVCAVMRSAMLLGMYSSTIGSHNMRSDTLLSPGIKTYPELMRQAGYYATNPAKTDYQGLATKSVWDNNKRNYLGRPDKSKPFMHVDNYTGTHESKARDNPGSYDINKLSSFPPYYPDTVKARRTWASHLQLITDMDTWVGKKLADLDKSGEADNTIVFFYSDHGSGVPRGKRWNYDSGLKIPLVIRVPKKWQHLMPHKVGSQTDELISTIDFTATVLGLAGIKIPKYMQGRVMLGENLSPERSYIHAHRDRMDERYEMTRAVKDKQFKYIRNYEYWKPNQQFNYYPELNKWSGIMEEIRRVHNEGNAPAVNNWFFETKLQEELYDTNKDPHELVNLAANPKYKAKLDELRTESIRWRNSSRDLGVIPEHILLERRGEKGEYQYGLDNQAAITASWKVLDNLHNYSVKEFIELMSNKDPVIRYWAATGLGNLKTGTKIVKSALKTSLKDDNVMVQGAAARGLLLLGPSKSATKTLVKLLGQKHSYNTVTILNALELMGDRADAVMAESASFAKPAENKKQRSRASAYVERALMTLEK